MNPALDSVTSGTPGASGQVFDGLDHISTDDLPAGPVDRSIQILEVTGEDSQITGMIIKGSANIGGEIPVIVGGQGHEFRNCEFLQLFSSATASIQISGFTVFENCRIEKCQSQVGPALDLQIDTICRLESCILAGNRSGSGPSVMSAASGAVLLMINNTVTGNLNTISGGTIALDDQAQVFMQNNIFHNNASLDPMLQLPSTAVLLRNIVEGGWPGDNFDLNPEFTDVAVGDFTPGPGSPCVDQGISAASSTATDCFGLPRIVCQGVDIGAVERQICGDGDSVDFIRGDCDTDGSLGLADAVVLLEYLFTGGALTCIATGDVNDDGALNLADPGSLLAYLFIGGVAPPAPSGACGQDPDGSLIACEVYPACP
ncbi:MAG: hypothetical protein CBC13_05715 [Planctomycetia bacterium TMED53]|nr:MAG: hypothetical protein CBC13_05715 [Planctomycetia bacterium TMED53]